MADSNSSTEDKKQESNSTEDKKQESNSTEDKKQESNSTEDKKQESNSTEDKKESSSAGDKKTKEDIKDISSFTKYYPYYHAASAPSKKSLPWINDPEGAVWDENARLFRAWAIFSPTYPVDTFNSDWLEFTSPDGVTWTPGVVKVETNSYNGGGLWGGSVIIDYWNTAGFGKGAVIYLITAAMNEAGNALPYQSVSRWVAPSLGVKPTFKDYVISNANDDSVDFDRDFRDPRVFWDQEHKYWVLSISVSYGIQFYKSYNTKEWEFLSCWLAPGCVYGQWGGVECPNLIRMYADNDQRKWVLFYSDQRPPRETVRCIVGEWNGTAFIPEDGEEPINLDYGWDFYAQSIYQKGDQTYMLGWLGNWNYAFSTPIEGFKNYLSLTRKLSLHYEGGWYKVRCTPLAAQDRIFSQENSIHIRGKTIGGEHPILPVGNIKTPVGFKVKLCLTAVNGRWPSNINLNVRANDEAFTQLFLLAHKGEARVYRGKSGHSPMQGLNEWYAPAIAPIDFSTGKIEVTAYVDSASVEYFFQNGDFVITTQTFPANDAFGISLTASSDGRCTVDSFTIFPLKEESERTED